MADHFDSSKNYVELEAIEDKWNRPSDWNTLTRILHKILGDQNFGSIFYEGAVVDGILPIRTSADNSFIYLTSGYIYLDGKVFPSTQTTVTGFDTTKTSGYDFVYANWQIERVTGLTDSDYVDTTTGENTVNPLRFAFTLDRIDKSGYGISGNVVRKNTSPIIVYIWNRSNGDIYSPRNKGSDGPNLNISSKLKLNQFDGLLDARKITAFTDNWEFNLALETLDYEVHGNYVVDGFTLQRTYTAESQAGQVAFVINPGVARVHGKRIERSTPTLKYVDDHSAHGEITMPTQSFTQIHDDGGLHYDGDAPYFYELWGHKVHNYYVNTISDFVSNWVYTATIQMSADVNRGASYTMWHKIGSDSIITRGISAIPDTISWTLPVGTGTEGTDYSLTKYNNEYFIKWESSGTWPTSVYTIPWVRGTYFEQDTDYTLTNNGYISFEGVTSSHLPEPGTTFTVEYTVIPNRYDLVVMSKYHRLWQYEDTVLRGQPYSEGTISIKTGVPALNPSVPDEPGLSMALGHLEITPWGSHNAKSYYKQRMPQEEIRLLSNRVLALEKQIKQDENKFDSYEQAPGTLSLPEGRLVESVVDAAVADLDFADGTYTYFGVMDFAGRYITQPLANFSINTLCFDNSDSSAIEQFRSVFSIATDSIETYISQDQYSSTVSLDPYGAYVSVGPFVKLNPNIETWFNMYEMNDTERRNTQHVAHLKRYEVSSVERFAFEFFSDSIPSKYSRNLPVIAEGWGFGSGEDGIRLYVDNTQCAISSIVSGTSGVATNVIKADAYGHFLAYATVVSAVSSSGIVRDGGKDVYAVGSNANTGYSVFKVMSNLDASHEGRVTNYPKIFNMAQIFYVDEDRFIGKIAIGFDQIDSTTEPITFMLCGVTNNIPSGEILWQTTYTPVDFSGTFPGKETIQLDNPIFVEGGKEYCIVLYTASEEYIIQKAVLGEVGRNPSGTIRELPYNNGRLYISENGLNWYPHDNKSLRFEVFGFTFSTSASHVLEFDQITGLSNFSAFFCGPCVFEPEGTNIVWAYSTDAGSTWNNFRPNGIVDPDEPDLDSSITIKCTMTTTNSKLSPLVAGVNHLSSGNTIIPINTWKYGTTTYHVTNPVNVPNVTITDVGGKFEIDSAYENTMEVYFKMEDIETPTWTQITAANIIKVKDLEDGFTFYRWHDTVASANRGHVVRFMVKIVANSSISEKGVTPIRDLVFYGTNRTISSKGGYAALGS